MSGIIDLIGRMRRALSRARSLSTRPLPLISQLDKFLAGMKRPVLAIDELVPSSVSPRRTPDVISVWFDAATSVK